MRELWRKIIDRIRKPERPAIFAATKPSQEQIDRARRILAFAGTAQYQDYIGHQGDEFIAAMKKAFTAAEAGNFNVLPLYVMEAKARYDVLGEVDWAHSIYDKISEIPKTITTRSDS